MPWVSWLLFGIVIGWFLGACTAGGRNESDSEEYYGHDEDEET